MFAAFRGELFKTVRRPAVWVCVIVLLAIVLTIDGIEWLVYTFPPAGTSANLPKGTTLADFKVTLYPINFVRVTLSSWNVLGGVFGLILGVLLQGSEFGWGTIKTLYIQRAGRLTMLLGKIAALAVVVLILVVSLLAVSAAASIVVALLDGKTIVLPPTDEIVRGLGAGFLIFGFWGIFGLALATVFRQSAMAIGLGLAYALVIEGLLLGLAAGFAGWVKQVQQWFPVANTGYLADSFGTVDIRGVRAQPPPFADATHAVAVLLLYVILFIGISAVLTRNRDVTA